MGALTSVIRFTRNLAFVPLLLAAALTLGTTPGFAASPASETIQATYAQADHMVSVTLTIYGYSTAAELQTLSQAFQQGQDRGLAAALFKTKAAGHCSITGILGYDVAFIQMVVTPTGRKITFITSRPHPFVEADPPDLSQPFDLAVGQFDLNDADPAKSTGYLYPASKLVIDQQGEFHYDLTGTPWPLVNVLASKEPPSETLALGPTK
jgi:hypothetical protein